MNTKSLLALLLAILLPMTGYLLVKAYSKNAVHMPHHYFYDSVITNEHNGKEISDTAWHHVKDMSFTNQLGKKVSLSDLHGKIIVLDFFFTTCPSICPGLARNMKRLQESFVKNDSIVQFLSVSIDPERDSLPRLRAFADRYHANHDTWWFLRADKKETYDFAIREIKANIADVHADTAFPHTTKFFLLDSNRIVRGFYDGFDTTELAQLAHDIPTLMLERDKKSPSVFRDFIPVLPVIFVGIGIIIFGIAWLERSKKIKPKY